MPELETVYRIAVCGTEVSQETWWGEDELEDSPWWTQHLTECVKCKADTKEAMRQTIASLTQQVETLTRNLSGYMRGMEERRQLLLDAKELLSNLAAATSQPWGLERAGWIERCNRSLDRSRP